MDLTQVIETVLSNTYTKVECSRRLLLVQDFFDHLIYSDATSTNDVSQAIKERYFDTPERQTALAVAAWGPEVLGLLSGTEGRKRLGDLRQKIEGLPELTLYVPVPLEPQLINSIGAWCRANVDPHVLLSLRIDPAVIGGCALVWNDAYWDFSISYFMDKHRSDLTHLIDTFEKAHV